MILIVEDDPDTRHAICEYLSALFPSARVVTSESGEGALALAQRIAPRVVLLDLRLGGMQGFEFAERLRRQVPGTATAIVALTGDTSADTADLDRLEAVLRPLLAEA
jgi:CheY-like chemotaxis protein